VFPEERPATGHDPAVTIRVPERSLAAASEWAEAQGIRSRSAALAQLIELGLSAAAKRPRKPKAD